MSTINQKSADAVSRVPNERLEDLFREAIQAKLNDPDCELKIQEFDLAIRKDVDQPVFVDMTVFGMAGDTTKDEFVGSDKQVVKGAGSVQLTLDDDTVVKLVFHDIVNLNATDYLVTYRLA